MGTLAQTLGRQVSVEVGGMTIDIKQLSIDDIFECMREAFAKFEERDKPIDQMAQEAIETGRIPLTSVSILITRACPALDDDDVNVLLSGGNMDHALKIAAAAMGNELAEDAPAQEKGGTPKKKRRR